MSPLQFQKQQRLHEARRLFESVDVLRLHFESVMKVHRNSVGNILVCLAFRRKKIESV